MTFTNGRRPQAVATEIPLEHLLVETDAPYLTPHPYRGTRNEPFYVSLVAKKIAEVYISSYITKHVPYGESKTDEYYFEVKYDEVDNAWLVMQYKANPKEIEQSDMVDKYTGNMIVLDKSTGKVLYVSYYDPRISVLNIGPVPWNGKDKAE